MAITAELLQGTLDLLILRTLELRPLHGVGISVVNALLIRNTQINHANIAQNVTAVNRALDNPNVAHFWSPFTSANKLVGIDKPSAGIMDSGSPLGGARNDADYSAAPAVSRDSAAASALCLASRSSPVS